MVDQFGIMQEELLALVELVAVELVVINLEHHNLEQLTLVVEVAVEIPCLSLVLVVQELW